MVLKNNVLFDRRYLKKLPISTKELEQYTKFTNSFHNFLKYFHQYNLDDSNLAIILTEIIEGYRISNLDLLTTLIAKLDGYTIPYYKPPLIDRITPGLKSFYEIAIYPTLPYFNLLKRFILAYVGLIFFGLIILKSLSTFTGKDYFSPYFIQVFIICIPGAVGLMNYFKK